MHFGWENSGDRFEAHNLVESDGIQFDITCEERESTGEEKTDIHYYYVKVNGELIEFNDRQCIGSGKFGNMWVVDLDKTDQYKEIVIEESDGVDSYIYIYRLSKDGLKVLFSKYVYEDDLIMANDKLILTNYLNSLDKKIKNEIKKLNEWSNKGEREAGRQGGMRSDSKIKGVKTNAQRKAAKLSSSAENKKKRLEKLREDFIDKPYESKDIKYFFNGEDLRANALVKLTDVSKEYDGKLIFENANFEIKSNDKIGLIGPNGCGKSTLIKIINGEIESTTGSIWKTPSLKMAYMSQDVFDIDDSLTINEFASRFDANKKQFFFSNLVNMGVDRSIFKNKISSLSLGQRMKIKLVQIILEEYNLLVLDEPTNHLDLENKIELENALITFPGSILIATHDRYLLKNLTNSLIVFENKEVKKIDKGYSEYFDDKMTNEKDNDIYNISTNKCHLFY